MEAAMSGIPGSMRRLFDRGADPGTRNTQGDTPLHLAVAAERSDLVTLLLGWGVNIHARNALGRTPFRIALGLSPRMVSTLLTRDRILAPDDDGLSPLHIAVMENVQPYVLGIIMEQGPRLNAVDSDGRTPLRLAVDRNAWPLARDLTEAGSDVFSLAKDNRTPAETAFAKGRDAVEALFSGKALNARDPSGNTALHYAARTGNLELIHYLLDLGCAKETRNFAGESPADTALRRRHTEAASLLR
jgi:ankyrin repeat protein